MSVKKDNKVCLVTGARTGIGKSISELLAKNGYRVILSPKRSGDCRDHINELTQKGFEVAELVLDLSKPEELKKTLEEAISIWGTIDILINNGAVVDPISKLGNLPLEHLVNSNEINFISPLMIINHCWDYLKKSKGRILNILSGAAIHPVEGWAAYCATKAALHMVNQQAHLEGIEHNITSIGISPGMVDTSMQGRIRKSGINHVSKVKKSDLLSTEVPANLALWCLSPEVKDLSGKMISLNDPLIEKRFKKWQLQRS